MHRAVLLTLISQLAWPLHAAACWVEAGQRYGVSPQLLYAIARVESALDPQAVNRSHRQRTGTYDIGLMQINSSNLRALAKLGIAEKDLYEPCTSIHVGAWLLAQNLVRHGQSWEGVGAYNAACTQLKGEACQRARQRYAWRVYRHLPSESLARNPAAPARHQDTWVKLDPVATAQPFILSARVSP